MKKTVLSVLAILIMQLHVCGFVTPSGIWACEELSMVLNFELKGGEMNWGEAEGTMIIEGEKRDVVCLMEPVGNRGQILYLNENGIYTSDDEILFLGRFRYKSADVLIFTETREGKEYTFVRQK